MKIEQLIRANIRQLQPYSCARDEYKGKEATFLDANENPFETGYNRYPDPHQRQLKARLAEIKGVEEKRMVLGNGSDEIIDLLIRTVCEPGVDNLVVFSPGYSMYEVSAAINAVEVRKINLTPEFLPDWTRMWQVVDAHTKMIFLCTPNNPTGKVIPIEDIEQLCREFQGLVVVDEAYVDFMEKPSAVTLLDKYPNLVVMQTLSKAWGMAGLRLGMCFACPKLVSVLNKVKAPYNISGLTQKTVLEVLEDYNVFLWKCLRIKKGRKWLLEALRELGIFRNVYDSEANFILVTSDACREVYQYLIRRKIVVRLRDIPPVIPGGIRITVGVELDNVRLVDALKKMRDEK